MRSKLQEDERAGSKGMDQGTEGIRLALFFLALLALTCCSVHAHQVKVALPWVSGLAKAA